MNEIANIYFDDKIICNFELSENNNSYNSIFEKNSDPNEILKLIEIKSGNKITEKTILIFDEIQYCKKVLTTMKYFYEMKPEIPIIAAGSLLGDIFCDNIEYSYPVGKIKEINIYPLNFNEFILELEPKLYDEFIN
jgi:predicted AAA+ superfamily ATPase